MNCVVLLQNAWSREYAGREWPRESWLRALHRSRTGRRLRVVFPDPNDPGVYYENTTPMVADDPDGVCEPDLGHVLDVLERRRPEFVLACGAQAKSVATRLWPGRLITTPHPAHRLVTNDLFALCRGMILSGDFHREALIQFPGLVERRAL
jgi:hypothetical protein